MVVRPNVPSSRRTSSIVLTSNVNFLGLRRNESSSAIVDQAQDLLEKKFLGAAASDSLEVPVAPPNLDSGDWRLGRE